MAEQKQTDVQKDRFGLTPEDYAKIDAQGARFLSGNDDGLVEITEGKLALTMSTIRGHVESLQKARGKRRG